MATHRKLFRTTDGKMLGGVAGGLAEYFGVNPIITRLLFIGLVIFGGSGILLYLLLWMIIPRDPFPTLSFDDTEERSSGGFAVFMKATGVALLLALTVTWATDAPFLIPFVIGMGLGLYYFGRGNEEGLSLAERFELYRSSDRKILGVFGGLAERFEMDPTVMRVIGVGLIFLTSGAAIPLYFLYALLIPKEDEPTVERIIIV